MTEKWCQSCKTLHVDGAHTRPQPVSPEVENKSLKLLLLEEQRAHAETKRQLAQALEDLEAVRAGMKPEP